VDTIRCSIIGNAGGGKSILARALSKRAGVPLFELDAYLWGGNWQSVPAEKFQADHAEMIGKDQWIIDGFGLPETLQPRLARSTHIIHVDLPIWLHFALAAERQSSWKDGTLKHPPGGMPAPPPTRHLFELMWRIHTELAPVVTEHVAAAAKHGSNVAVVQTIDRLRELQFDPSRILQ